MIPDELQKQDRWVARQGKDYVCCETGQPAYVTDPSTWTSYERARAFCFECGGESAFAVTSDLPYTVVELHSARNPKTDVIDPKAISFIKKLDSYSEVSWEGADIRIVVRGRLPVPTSGARNGAVELFNALCFVQLTGETVTDTRPTIEDRQEELTSLWKWLARVPEDRLVTPEVGLTDDKVIARAERAYGDKFRQLWSGDKPPHDHEEQAELALLGYLAYWTRHDVDRMTALFEKSGLVDHQRWRRLNYREPTLRAALRLTLTSVNKEQHRVLGKKRINTAGPSPATFADAKEKNQQGKPIGVKEAIELASLHTKTSYWAASFALARRMRTISAANPEQFEPAVAAFCEKSGHVHEDLLLAFLNCWDKVRSAEGDDVLTWAFQQAKARPHPVPIPCPCGAGGKYHTVYSTAHRLAEVTRDDPFLLPVERLGALLGTSAMTVSNIIGLLEKNGVIICTKEDYKFSKKQAKEYRLAGPHC